MGSTPSAPKYDTNAAIAGQNRVNLAVANQTYADMNSPLGGYSVSVDPETGQMTVNKVLSGNSQAAQNAQNAALEQYYAANPATAEQAYYNAQMAYLQPQMQRQVTRTESGLINRGIGLGSNAWNEATGDVYDMQNQTLANLSTNVVGAGQQYKSNIMGNASMLGGQILDPTLVGGQLGAGYADIYDPSYQNALSNYQTKLANNNAAQRVMGTVGGVAGGIIGGIYGGPGGAALGAGIGGAAGSAVGASADRA